MTLQQPHYSARDGARARVDTKSRAHVHGHKCMDACAWAQVHREVAVPAPLMLHVARSAAVPGLVSHDKPRVVAQPQRTGPDGRVQSEPPSPSSGGGEGGEGGGDSGGNQQQYYKFLGMKISKEDIVTITLALAISYGIRWWVRKACCRP